MKILSMGASSSSKSINRQLADWAAAELAKKKPGAVVDRLDLNDFEMPIYSADREAANGIEVKAKVFIDRVRGSDFIVISFAEHNGSYTAAFKNILDWASRAESKPWLSKPMLMLATSHGARGGISVLESAKARFPFLGADIKGSFSLPEFGKNFTPTLGITNPEQLQKFMAALSSI